MGTAHANPKRRAVREKSGFEDPPLAKNISRNQSMASFV